MKCNNTIQTHFIRK